MTILENVVSINVVGGIMMEIGITDSNCKLIFGSTNESDSHLKYNVTDIPQARHTDVRGFHVNALCASRFMNVIRTHMSPNHLFRP